MGLKPVLQASTQVYRSIKPCDLMAFTTYGLYDCWLDSCLIWQFINSPLLNVTLSYYTTLTNTNRYTCTIVKIGRGCDTDRPTTRNWGCPQPFACAKTNARPHNTAPRTAPFLVTKKDHTLKRCAQFAWFVFAHSKGWVSLTGTAD